MKNRQKSYSFYLHWSLIAYGTNGRETEQMFSHSGLFYNAKRASLIFSFLFSLNAPRICEICKLLINIINGKNWKLSSSKQDKFVSNVLEKEQGANT